MTPGHRTLDGPTRTLLTLTFVTGIVDAVTFLGLGQVFSAMQTGNVIFLGVGIAGSAGAPVVAPLLALAAFVVGGVAAALLARGPARGLGVAIAIEVALLALAATAAAAIDVRPDEASGYLLIALLSLAMGLRNTAAREVGSQNLATTVLNLTIISVTAGLSAIAVGEDLAQRAIAFLTILAGAVTGALLLKTSLPLAIAVAAAIALAARLSHQSVPRLAHDKPPAPR